MIFHSFYEYWKQFGQFHNEVINSPTELEETLKSLSAKIWKDAEGSSERTYDDGYSDGWDECEAHYKIKVDSTVKIS